MLLWIALLSICLSVELVFIGSLVSAIFPAAPVKLTASLFEVYRQQIIPERDVFFFHVLVFSALFIFALLMRYKAKWQTDKFKLFTCFEMFIVTAQTFCIFKLLVFREQIWLNGFYGILAAGLLGKIFWPELSKTIERINARLKIPSPIQMVTPWGNILVFIGLAALIWVPDIEGALAKIFFGEQFHHLDFFLVPAGWSHITGNIPGIDTISRYGIGAPVVISEIGKIVFGKFSYASALIVIMAMSVAYYWLWFLLFRKFFGNFAWAVLAVLAGLRVQFFHTETLPFIFTYPQVTPMRFFFDALLFLTLVFYIRRPRFSMLLAAASVAGFSIFWITGEGLYMLCAFYGFLILREAYAYLSNDDYVKPLKNGQRALVIALPWVVMLSFVILTVGKYAFSREFWNSQLEFIRFYEAGQGSAPMINNLISGFILQAGWAFVLPVLYVLALVVTLGAMFEKKIGREGLVISSAIIYLLADFHYQAMLSNNTTAYLRTGIIISFIAFYGLSLWMRSCSLYAQRLAKLGLLFVILISIVTNHQFLMHPNVFNLSRNPMSHPPVSHNPPGRSSYFNHLFISYPDQFKLPKNSLGEQQEFLVTEANFVDDRQLKDFYHQEINYGKDAQLIDDLTAPDSKVPVISSFEIPILMQANRRPFFYTLDLVNSRPRRMRTFAVTLLYTVDNLKKELERLDNLKPPYVFVEKIFLTPQFPEAYLRDSQDLIMLLQQVLSRYQPYKEGEYLTALKRKDS
jgi:hypothetical protein